MILDSTPSMLQVGKIDSDCIASNPSLLLYPEQCSEEGIQTLLGYLIPAPRPKETASPAAPPVSSRTRLIRLP